MEIFRALGALVEPPRADLQPVADALGLGALPPMAEHSDLFAFRLYPYASVYLGEEGMLGGEARDRVAGFWRVLGLESPAEPDHLTVLLAFYAQLTGNSPSKTEVPSEPDPRRQQAGRVFYREHLISWLPVYLARLAEVASPFYRRWGELLGEALSDPANGEANPTAARLPLALRQAPPMVDPRRDGAKDFLLALLSPVRCGFILLRDDLLRAGGELGLAARVGERRFVLEALLSQGPEATLGWLSRFASQQAASHRSLLGPGWLSTFWSERAEASAGLLAELRDSAE